MPDRWINYFAFLLYDKLRSKTSWEKHSIMQIKLEHLMLSLTNEISMVGIRQFQVLNETVCMIEGKTDGNWGSICVLAVGDLYQLHPIGQSSIYMSPWNIQTLNDFSPNGWEKMQLHDLTQIKRQKDMCFAECLNNIHTTVPEKSSEEDIMLQGCEVK